MIKPREIKLHLASKYFEVRDSDIHGKGLFSLENFDVDTELGPAFFYKTVQSKYKKYWVPDYALNLSQDWLQTSATRYMNHSHKSNIKFYRVDDEIIYAKCAVKINRGDEVTVDYREAFQLMGLALPQWLRDKKGSRLYLTHV